MIIHKHPSGTLLTGNFQAQHQEALLDAISSQRWFYFKKRLGIIFDRTTGLVWNTDYGLPYQNEGRGTYKREVASKIREQLLLAGVKHWEFPTEEAYSKLVSELGVTDFPYADSLEFPPLFLIDPHSNKPQLDSGSLLLCSKHFFTQNYSDQIHLKFPEYSSQFTLELFLSHKLQPLFDNQEINGLYTKVLDNYKQGHKTSASQQTRVPRLIFTFDPKDLLTLYPSEVIDRSFLQYGKAVQSVTELFLHKLSQYEEVNQAHLIRFEHISLKLAKSYQDSPDLSQEENQQLASYHSFFQKQFTLSTQVIREQFLSIKAQGEGLEHRAEEASQTDRSITLLAEIEQEQRVSFSLLVENMANILCTSLGKMEFFQEHEQFVNTILNTWEQVQDNYKELKSQHFQAFIRQSIHSDIKSKIYTTWLVTWGKLRFFLDSLFTPLIEFSIKGHLLEPVELSSQEENSAEQVNTARYCLAEEILRLFDGLKETINEFYLKKQVAIYEKNVKLSPTTAEATTTLQSCWELYQLFSQFQENFAPLLFSIDSSDTRLFLISWSRPLLNLQVETLIHIFSQDSDALHPYMKELSQLKQQNFAPFVYSDRTYLQTLKQRETDFHLLTTRLKKELLK